MLTETEKYLISAIQKGDCQAFEALFISYYSDLCSFARKYVYTDENAEDLVSDLFVKIWEQPSLLAANVSLSGYMYRTVYNSCINYITRVHSKFRNLDPVTVNKLKELIRSDSEDSPETGLMAVELDEAIKKAIGQLPAQCGKIFLMSREEGLSHREIAHKLNISENTVKVQVYNALLKLKEALIEFL
jgi:RNA polymerase sigma-70 factor, ECF subfamily